MAQDDPELTPAQPAEAEAPKQAASPKVDNPIPPLTPRPPRNGKDTTKDGSREPKDGSRDNREVREPAAASSEPSPSGPDGSREPRPGLEADSVGALTKSGILEILPEGWGFLRQNNFDPGSQDIYVAQAQIKRFNLKTGDTVTGQVRPPKDTEKYYGLLRVESVNSASPDQAAAGSISTIWFRSTPKSAFFWKPIPRT